MTNTEVKAPMANSIPQPGPWTQEPPLNETFEQRVSRYASLEEKALGELLPSADIVTVPLYEGESVSAGQTFRLTASTQLRPDRVVTREGGNREVVLVVEEAPASPPRSPADSKPQVNTEQLREDAEWARLAANPTQGRMLGTTVLNCPLVDEEVDRLTRLASYAEKLARVREAILTKTSQYPKSYQEAHSPDDCMDDLFADELTALLGEGKTAEADEGGA